jgi:glycosyltransferase involved in cell wall biosynthesis
MTDLSFQTKDGRGFSKATFRRVPTWNILIASIPHRNEMLTQLLAELNRQYQPGLGVIVAVDNCDIPYGDKCQKILDASEADYISFLDDDDWIEPDFVSAIMNALDLDPDYVGFNVDFTEDGVRQMPVYHSLQYNGWTNNPEALYRDIVHFNPIRRALAIQAKWAGGCGADRQWADQLRDLGIVKTEVYIDRELHHYRKIGPGFVVPERLAEVPPRPDGYTFVRWLEI